MARRGVPKKKECDRCGGDHLVAEMIFWKGYYFCPDCLDDDYKDKYAILSAGVIKNFNPYLGPVQPQPPGEGAYGYSYGKYYGEGL